MKFAIKYFLVNVTNPSFLLVWSHLLKNFCLVKVRRNQSLADGKPGIAVVQRPERKYIFQILN